MGGERDFPARMRYRERTRISDASDRTVYLRPSNGKA